MIRGIVVALGLSIVVPSAGAVPGPTRTLRKVALSGELPAGGPANDVYHDFADGAVIDRYGNVGFIASHGPGGDASGVWVESASGLRSVAISGDAAPTTGRSAGGSFDSSFITSETLPFLPRNCACAARIACSSDSGWITEENPLLVRDRKRAVGFYPPLDIVDGAARVLDPVFQGVQGSPGFGRFLKDYKAAPW